MRRIEEAQESQRFSIEVLPILGESSASVEPSNGAFDDPTARQYHKSFGVIGAFDDFSFEVWEDFRQAFWNSGP